MNKTIICAREDQRVIITTDIHGCYDKLKELIYDLGIEEDDILIIAGDLVDRGPESRKVVEFVCNRPNTFAIKGNHEHMLIQALTSGKLADMITLSLNGGDWIHDDKDPTELVNMLQKLHNIIEVRKGDQRVGVIHAEPDTDDWETIGTETPIALIWGRNRLGYGVTDTIKNIDYIVAGHTIVSNPTYTGNVKHIDAGAFLGNDLFYVEI